MVSHREGVRERIRQYVDRSETAGGWRRVGSNHRQHDYESCALPLSYAALGKGPQRAPRAFALSLRFLARCLASATRFRLFSVGKPLVGPTAGRWTASPSVRIVVNARVGRAGGHGIRTPGPSLPPRLYLADFEGLPRTQSPGGGHRVSRASTAKKEAPPRAPPRWFQKVVAGVGFEPTTFGL